MGRPRLLHALKGANALKGITVRARATALCSGLALAALVLAGCGSGAAQDDPAASASASGESASAGTEPTTVEGLFGASGDFGEKPTLEFPTDSPPDGLLVETLIEGDGDVVQPGSRVVAHYLGQVWGGQEPFDNSYDRGAPSVFSLSTVVQGWTHGIPGQRVGSRILLSIPAQLGYGPAGGNAGAGIGAEDTIVFVVDLVDAYALDATGQADAEDSGEDVPVIFSAAPGEPVTDLALDPDAELATEMSSVVVARGTGPALAVGDHLIFQAAAVSDDGSQVSSTWDGGDLAPGPQAELVAQGDPLWEALIGVEIGSRVVVAQAGDDTYSGFAAVLDLLGVVPTS